MAQLAAQSAGNGSLHGAPVETLPRWQFIWCHERCRKHDRQPVYDLISRMVKEMGGRFFCVKKATSYETWREREGARGPHVLLTDGREVRPCVEALDSADDAANPPALIVVLSEEMRPHERVRTWVSGRVAEGAPHEMRVIQDAHDLQGILADVVSRLAETDVIEEDGVEMPIMEAFDDEPEIEGDDTAVIAAEPQLARFRFSPSCPQQIPFVKEQAAMLSAPVAGMLGAICPWQSAEQVERLLYEAAMHQVYED